MNDLSDLVSQHDHGTVTTYVSYRFVSSISYNVQYMYIVLHSFSSFYGSEKCFQKQSKYVP